MKWSLRFLIYTFLKTTPHKHKLLQTHTIHLENIFISILVPTEPETLQARGQCTVNAFLSGLIPTITLTFYISEMGPTADFECLQEADVPYQGGDKQVKEGRDPLSVIC